MKIKKFILFIIIFVFQVLVLNSQEIKINLFNFFTTENIFKKDIEYYNETNKFRVLDNFFNYYDLGKYQYEKKEELLIRRSEILFFGSLTFVTFGAWVFFSVFNTLIYNEPFGKIRREQFLPMFLGSGTISIGVVITDLFINIQPKLNEYKIEMYKHD